jgi:nucleotide-binding universal stress UspA family protein
MQSLPIRSILVASDLLKHSDDLLSSAAVLTTRLGADLHIIHALEFATVPQSAMGTSGEFHRHGEDARQALEDQVRYAIPEGVRPASQNVRTDSAPTAILERAREVGADLIVIGPARPRPFRGPILGNTSDRIIRTSTAPVLVLGAWTEFRLHRVVVPLDLADPARGALDQALTWAGMFGQTNLGPVDVRVPYVIPFRYRQMDTDFDRLIVRPQLRLEIEDAEQRVQMEPHIETRAETLWGDVPSEEIVRYVECRATDLLVLGTHGYGALGRAFIGSVTSQIVRSATCPMLLIPPSMWAVERGPAMP